MFLIKIYHIKINKLNITIKIKYLIAFLKLLQCSKHSTKIMYDIYTMVYISTIIDKIYILL